MRLQIVSHKVLRMVRNQASGGCSGRGFLFMALLALQFGLQPLVTKAFVDEGADKVCLVFLCEVMKFFVAVILLVTEGGKAGRAALRSWTFSESLSCGAFPAGIYAVQNVFIQIGYQSISGMMFNLLNQTKIFFTAVMVFLLTGRSQSNMQIVALILVVAVGVTLTLEKEEGGTDHVSEKSLKTSDTMLYSIVPTLVASLLSGIGAGWSQRVTTTGSSKRHAYMFSAELSFYGALLLLGNMAYASGVSNVPSRVLSLTENNGRCWIPILTNAAGGIFVGQVVKYAGSVRKSFSVIFGIIITCVAEYALFDAHLSPKVCACVPVVLLAMYIYATNPPKMKRA